MITRPKRVLIMEYMDGIPIMDLGNEIAKRGINPHGKVAAAAMHICYNTDEWELMNKYAKRFVKAGVKLRQTSFGTWMQFAAKRGEHISSILFYLIFLSHLPKS